MKRVFAFSVIFSYCEQQNILQDVDLSAERMLVVDFSTSFYVYSDVVGYIEQPQQDLLTVSPKHLIF